MTHEVKRDAILDRQRGCVSDATHAKHLDLGLATSILRVFIKQIEGLAGFFSVIYWIVLKHFNRILSTRWSDFTAQAFGLWKKGAAPHSCTM